MASIHPRYSSTDPNKITGYKVTWRDAEGHQRGQTVSSRREADRIKKRAQEYGKDPERQRIVRKGDSGLHVSLRNGESVVRAGPRPADRYGNLYITGYVDSFLHQHPYADGSRRVVEINLRKHVIPAFSNRAMKDIEAADVDRFIRELEATDLTGATIRRVRSAASALWTDAVRDGIVPGNPWLGAKVKPHVARIKWPMTLEHFRLICEAIPQPSYNLFVRTLGQTGLRYAEATRLMPGDIVGNTLHVRKSKSRAGVRKIPISTKLATELRAWLPFRSPQGHPLRYTDFRYVWNPVVEGMLCDQHCRAECDVHPRMAFTPHDLRHGHTSWLIADGVPLTVVRDRLGHSSLEITSRYAHALDDGGVLDALDRLFGDAA